MRIESLDEVDVSVRERVRVVLERARERRLIWVQDAARVYGLGASTLGALVNREILYGVRRREQKGVLLYVDRREVAAWCSLDKGAKQRIGKGRSTLWEESGVLMPLRAEVWTGVRPKRAPRAEVWYCAGRLVGPELNV